MWILTQNKKVLTDGNICLKVYEDITEDLNKVYYILLKNYSNNKEIFIAEYPSETQAIKSLENAIYYINHCSNPNFVFPFPLKDYIK